MEKNTLNERNCEEIFNQKKIYRLEFRRLSRRMSSKHISDVHDVSYDDPAIFHGLSCQKELERVGFRVERS